MSKQQPEAKVDVWQGTLALMVLKTLEVMGPLHGFGLARRIEQTSGDRLALNPGTLYPMLLKLEQEGSIESEWGASENNRRARFYRLTRAGRKQLEKEAREWQSATHHGALPSPESVAMIDLCGAGKDSRYIGRTVAASGAGRDGANDCSSIATDLN
jgi:transcriptional regulator